MKDNSSSTDQMIPELYYSWDGNVNKIMVIKKVFYDATVGKPFGV